MPQLPITGPAEVWAVGGAYERYIGRWSRLVAAAFVPWVGAPAGAWWLDAGCGTGALAAAVLAGAGPAGVLGVDRSPGFVAAARAGTTGASFAVADAARLPVADAAVGAAVSGLVLNFLPEPLAAVRELARVTAPGGPVAAYVWDYAGRMELLRHFWDAAVALDPAAAALDEGERFPLCRQGALAELFAAAGLERVEAGALEVPTRFADVDDYWAPFLGGQGPAPGYVAGLTPAATEALRAALAARLPAAADGSIELVARAWTARGLTSARR
jgi:SAM-dependent methyltransferase